MKTRVIIFILLVIGLLYAQASPLITIMPLSSSGISPADLAIFEDYLAVNIQETGRYMVLERREREVLLEELQYQLNDCTDENCRIELGKMLAADYFISGSLGFIAERYILNLKLVEVETGETVATKSDKYPGLGFLIDQTPELIKNFLGEDIIEEKITPEEEIRLLIDFNMASSKIDKKRFSSWVSDLELDEELEKGTPQKRNSILDQYINECLPTGLSIQYGALGGWFDNSYSKKTTNPADNTTYDETGTVNGWDAGGAFGLMYRLPSHFGLGIWLDAYLRSYERNKDFYLNGEIVEEDEYGDFSYFFEDNIDRIDFMISGAIFLDYPLFPDSIGIMIGLGISDDTVRDTMFSSSCIVPTVGIRLWTFIIRYSYAFSPLYNTGNHQFAVLFSSALGF